MGNQELLTDYIKRYICNESGLNSAIMIKGKWGCGKTYFIKKILSPNLEDTLKSKDKRLCYISLNGLSSIKEFMKRIQSVIMKVNFDLNSDKTDSSSIDIITGLDSIFDEINLQGWVNLAFGAKRKFERSITKKNISSSVFVFDDLERCAIPLKEILGTINDLVEHKKCKCIIVANEEEIKENQNFSKVKEKFISRTLEFIPDVEDFFKMQKRIYMNKPLGKLNDENWNEFIKIKSCFHGFNLRIIQSTLHVTNEICNICDDRISLEKEDIIQYILYKLLNDTYTIEKWYKEGNPRPENDSARKILRTYNFGLNGNYEDYKEVFEFIFDIIYNGIYDENTILRNIEDYLYDIKVNGKLSPITKLKKCYLMEDEDIQEQLNEIPATIKNISVYQASDLFNFLIPLIDIGFTYKDISDFDKILDLILMEINIFKTPDDEDFKITEKCTTLDDEQKRKYIETMKKVEPVLKPLEKAPEQKIADILKSKNWINELQQDMKMNQYDYCKEKKYLAYFDIDILLDKLKLAFNSELIDFKTMLYSLYISSDNISTFENDIETVSLFTKKLETLEIPRKINKLTIKRIIKELKIKFPQN